MALDNTQLGGSVFADYAAKQGDFGGFLNPPQGQQGIASLPQAAPPAFGGSIAQQFPVQNPIDEVKNSPFFQFYNTWKGASKEKQKVATQRLAQDVPNPEAMGLPFDRSIFGDPKTNQESGIAEPDAGAWDKFLKFADGNPQFLLDLGAQLLAPRQAGTSQLGNIASALSTSVERLSQRKKAAVAEELATRKTEAGIAGVKAQTSLVPSEIEKNKAKAFDLRRGKITGSKTAKEAVFDKVTDALWEIGGTGPDAVFQTKAEAVLAAQAEISGQSDIDKKAFYKQVNENAFDVGGAQAVVDSLLTLKAAPGTALATLKAQVAANRKRRLANTPEARQEQEAVQIKFMEDLSYDREKVADYLATLPQMAGRSREDLLRFADANIKKVRLLSGVKAPAKKAKPKRKALSGEVANKGTKETADFMKTAKSKSLRELRKWKKANGKTLSLRQRRELSRLIQSKAFKAKG